jgi:tripartite-type tricarboxylate transporter receptor subunit TctC
MKKLAIFAAAVLAFAALSTFAQAPWPAKPVKLIAVFPPGGSVDQVARIFAAQLSTQTGQPFVVENKGGASGSIGAQAVASAPPDGYTFGVVFDTHAVNASLIPDLPFDTLKDLAPVMLVGTSAMAIVVHASQPWGSFRDVITAAKNFPNGLSFGSIGTTDIAEAATAAGHKLSRSEVRMPNGPLRSVGEHVVSVHLHTDINVDLPVTIVAEEQA